MSELGATEKNLVRAYVFGFTLSTRTLLGAVGTSHSGPIAEVQDDPGHIR